MACPPSWYVFIQCHFFLSTLVNWLISFFVDARSFFRTGTVRLTAAALPVSAQRSITTINITVSCHLIYMIDYPTM
jgi:hypothetical protein